MFVSHLHGAPRRKVNNNPTASGAACMFYAVVVGVKQRLALVLARVLSACSKSFNLRRTAEPLDTFLSLIWIPGISYYTYLPMQTVCLDVETCAQGYKNIHNTGM